MKIRIFVLLFALLVASFAIPSAWTQTTNQQSNYIFRYNTGISQVFLSTMTFASERSLDLGACTTSEKINGPFSCAVNCTNDSVCLLELSGPAGATVNDVMEKVSETPVSGASAGMLSPSPSNSTLNSRPGIGKWLQVPGASTIDGHIAAYNSASSGS